jgi:hypothetical protein
MFVYNEVLEPISILIQQSWNIFKKISKNLVSADQVLSGLTLVGQVLYGLIVCDATVW